MIILHTSSSLSTSAQEEVVDPRAPEFLLKLVKVLAARGVRVSYGTLGSLFPSGRHQPGQRGAYLIHMVPRKYQWVACQAKGGYDPKAFEDWDLRPEYLQAPIMSLEGAKRVMERIEELCR